MKKLFILVLLLGLTSIQAQSSVGVYLGYGQSAFSDDFFGDSDQEQSGFIPIGLQVTLGRGAFQFGAEASYSLVPFTWEVENFGNKVGEIKITQLFGGLFGRFNFKLANEKLIPYVKAGGGAYLGKWIVDPEEGEEMDENFKTAFGFYAALGVDFQLSPTSMIFLEVPYHVVSRKLDDDAFEDVDAEGANNYALLVGFRLLFR